MANVRPLALLIGLAATQAGCFHFAGSGGIEATPSRAADGRESTHTLFPGRGEVGMDVGYGLATATVGIEDASKRGKPLGQAGDFRRQRVFGTVAVGYPAEGFCMPKDMATKNCGLAYLKAEYDLDDISQSFVAGDGRTRTLHQRGIGRGGAIGWRKHVFGAEYTSSQIYGGYFVELFGAKIGYERPLVPEDTAVPLTAYDSSMFGLRAGVFVDGRSYRWLVDKFKPSGAR